MSKKVSTTKQKLTPKKVAMIKALEKSLGIVTTACKTTGTPRGTHYKWMKEDEEYARQARDLDDIVLDFAESQLHKQIKNGNTTATIFMLKTKGRERGYIERKEIEQDINLTKYEVESDG